MVHLFKRLKSAALKDAPRGKEALESIEAELDFIIDKARAGAAERAGIQRDPASSGKIEKDSPISSEKGVRAPREVDLK